MSAELAPEHCACCKLPIKGERSYYAWHIFGVLQPGSGPYHTECFEKWIGPYVKRVWEAVQTN